MMNYKWKSKPLRDVAKYTNSRSKTEKLAREYVEKVKHNPTNAIAKTFAIHPGTSELNFEKNTIFKQNETNFSTSSLSDVVKIIS